MPALKPGQTADIPAKAGVSIDELRKDPEVAKKLDDYDAQIKRYEEQLKTADAWDKNYIRDDIKQTHANKEAYIRAMLYTPKYLNLIETECSEALAAYQSVGKFLFRGFRDDVPVALKGRPFDKRKPTDTNLKVHEFLSDMFIAAGFKATRSNSIFCSGNSSQAIGYGKLYLVFPKNGFAFNWSPKHEDFYSSFTSGLHIDKLKNQLSNAGEGGAAKLSKDYVSNQLGEDILWRIQNRADNIIYDNKYNAPKTNPLVAIAAKVRDAAKTLQHSLWNGADKMNLKDIEKFFAIVHQLNAQPKVRAKFITNDEMKKLGYFFSRKLRELEDSKKAVKEQIDPKKASVFLRDQHKFDDKDFAAAVKSGNEVCIHGEYYAFSAQAFRNIFEEKLLTGKGKGKK